MSGKNVSDILGFGRRVCGAGGRKVTDVKSNKLRRVMFSLSPEWKKEEEELRRRLTQEGILCGGFSEAELPLIKEDVDTVILTDSPETGAKLAREGVVYFGCHHDQENQQKRIHEKNSADSSDLPETSGAAKTEGTEIWFQGAALVLEGFEEVDAEYLEEWMLRAKGLPVTIARTERLVIREIADEDIPELEQIAGQDSKAGPDNKNFCTEEKSYIQEKRFTEEHLFSYRKTAYRLQGFGLWSVLYQDRVIGCCGFAPWEDEAKTAESVAPQSASGKQADMIQNQTEVLSDRADLSLGQAARIMQYHRTLREPVDCKGTVGRTEPDGSPFCNILELQYMLDTVYHRQGFGTEMCRAALDYARERLNVDEVWLRIRADNAASRALAEKLGFILESCV